MLEDDLRTAKPGDILLAKQHRGYPMYALGWKILGIRYRRSDTMKRNPIFHIEHFPTGRTYSDITMSLFGEDRAYWVMNAKQYKRKKNAAKQRRG